MEIRHLVVSKGGPDRAEVLAGFNAGLGEMTADGTLKAIMAKHGF